MKSKRSYLSSAFSFFSKFVSRRRRSVSSPTLAAGKTGAETCTSSSSSLSSLRSLHSLPEIVYSSSSSHCSPHSIRPQSGNSIHEVNGVDDALELFNQMVSASPLPSILCFNRLLSRVVKMKGYSVVVNLFQDMRSRGISIDVCTFNIMLDAYSHSDPADCGFCVLGLLFKCGTGITVITFNTLIKGLCMNNKVVEGVELFKKLVREKVCQVDNFTYCILMKGLCKAGYTQTALDLLIVMQKEGPQPDNVAYSTVIDSLCKDRMVNRALGLLPQMIERGVSPNIFAYNSLIKGLCNFCRWKEVTTLMNEMVHHEVYPDVFTFTILVDAFCKEGKLKDAEAIIQIMIQRNIYPDAVTCNSLIEGFCLQGQMDDARKVLVQMVEKGLRPNLKSYTTIINGYCKRKELDKAMHIFHGMPQKGLYPNVATYNTLLQGLFLEGRCGDALNLFQDMQLSGHAPDFHTYCVLLKGLCVNRHTEEAMSVYSKLHSNMIGSHVFGSIIIDGLCKVGLLNIARGVLSNLIFKGQHVNVHTYTAMINGLCREGETDAALDLFWKMGETDCLPDTITYNVILQEFLRVNKLHEANSLLDEMASKGVSPDGVTLSLMNDLLALGTGDEAVMNVIQKFAE